MAEQYWIGGFFIDLSRNQITQNKQSQIIAPKALAVLTYLAENQGKVVSQDTLLTNVWPDTVVSPNTLQRSIAQLRKALGDDSKVQIYIKTHAKQGYSLECDVRWHDKASSSKADPADIDCAGDEAVEASLVNGADYETNTTAKPESSQPGLGLMAIVLGIVFLAVMGASYLIPEQTSKLSFGELRSLTATDNKELAGIYSPDGQYVVFLRYSGEFCQNNIWAKNIDTQEESRLTENLGSYGSHSFSRDGKQLVFIESADCNKPITQKQCYKLMSFDFHKALETPQSPSLLMECKNSKIIKPKWLNNSNVALLQEFSNRWKLASYSIADNKSTVIYERQDGNIIDYDYSVADDLIALTSIHHDGHYYIEVLKPDGQVLSSHRIKYPKEIANFKLIYPNFSPVENQLVFSTGRQLFTLSYDGQVSNISLPLDEPMGSPVFHPGGKRMLVIKGHYDSDIVSVPLSRIKQAQSQNLSVLERSILGEDSAILQPDGELIAYESERSGDEQLWITGGKGSRQLSRFPMDTDINGMEWAADGTSLLVNANYALTRVYLDARQQSFPLAYPVAELFQWDSNNNSALLLVRIKGVLTLAELNLASLELRIINDKKVNWADKSESGDLVYIDDMDRFWQSGPAEDLHIEALDGQGRSERRFLVKDNVIYGVNDDFQLWSYALNGDRFELIGELPDNVDYLTDIDQTQLLMTVRVSAKKEVAELSLSE
ncbi:winged helix-turn-helix domain-containing protein [Thalassomonas actiniarum]|uniref:Winged helix-turn-helix domain-containing protein n=1 Tax=Thalassomonas actiniarum TaxID=485447 RepID=A0AAE9YTB0_9GAMM|nr:transcriptional regulator [Thalassomonas actiniarum]WDD99221.1 winged helix-turn-helix domain-containing protein [Thalassomonas actiniarum]